MKPALFIMIMALVGCTTTKHQLSPELCPEAPEVVLPEPPSAVTEDPAAEDFLGRLLKQFEKGDKK